VKSYSDRHLDPLEAKAYRGKFERSVSRRLSHRRERLLIQKAVETAIQLLPPVLDSREGLLLLDFPCGAGRFAPLFAERVSHYQPADHSPYMLELCLQALTESGLAGRSREGVQADARKMPFEDQSFDLACCIRLIHHFQNPEERGQILREFRRVNRGPLVLTWLDGDSPKQRLHELRCKLSGRASRRAPISQKQVQEETEDAGYQLFRSWKLSGLFSGQAVGVFEAVGLPPAA
jgi:SAM-dependent methyltransferase